MQALARSDKTRAELRALLLRHSEDEGEVDALLGTLEFQKLLSDARTAESRARRAREKGHASARILGDLERAGVDASVASTVAGEPAEDRASLSVRAASLLGTAPSSRDRARVARRLLRMGYQEDDVARACGLDGSLDPENGP